MWGRLGANRAVALCVLLLVESQATLSSLLSVSAHVGDVATLPCNWTRQPQATLPADPQSVHLQWQTPDDIVFEMKGKFLFQAPSYQGRATVDHEWLSDGDCSLRLHDLHFSDAGLYESFIISGHKHAKKRSFIENVLLRVTDHKARYTLQAGDDLMLTLHSPQAVRVVFQGFQDDSGRIVWERSSEGDTKSRWELRDKILFYPGLDFQDGGIYKVLDSQGRAISTTHLTVDEGDKNSSESLLIKDAESQTQYSSAYGTERVASATTVMFVVLMLCL